MSKVRKKDLVGINDKTVEIIKAATNNGTYTTTNDINYNFVIPIEYIEP